MSTWSKMRHEASKRDADRQRQSQISREIAERRARAREAFDAHKAAMEARFGRPAVSVYDSKTNSTTWTCSGRVIGTAVGPLGVDHQIIHPED